jgi:hypothetical protein
MAFYRRLERTMPAGGRWPSLEVNAAFFSAFDGT